MARVKQVCRQVPGGYTVATWAHYVEQQRQLELRQLEEAKKLEEEEAAARKEEQKKARRAQSLTSHKYNLRSGSTQSRKFCEGGSNDISKVVQKTRAEGRQCELRSRKENQLVKSTQPVQSRGVNRDTIEKVNNKQVTKLHKYGLRSSSAHTKNSMASLTHQPKE